MCTYSTDLPPYNNQHWVLGKRVGGVWTALDSGPATGLQANQWSPVKMEFKGDQISCYINDELKTTKSDTSVNGYRFGLEAGGSGVYFDNVVVTLFP
jgi:hypothetical protein